MSALFPCDTICCECKTGYIENEGVKRACPVCDGDPLITLAVVKEYARQIDAARKHVLTLELALYCYYAKHQEEALCDCRMCVTTRRILHLAVEDDRAPAQRKMNALDELAEIRA
jgi:hypothetical protein